MLQIYSAQVDKYKDLPDTIQELSGLLCDKSEIDLAGKIKKNNVGKPTFSFGKYTDKNEKSQYMR